MIRGCFSVLFMLLSGYAFSQQADSLQLVNPLDTLSIPDLSEIDSLYAGPISQLDSIQLETNNQLAALNHQYDSVNTYFDSRLQKLTLVKDSLTNLNLPTTSIERKLDSLQNTKFTQLELLKSKASDVKSKAIGEIDKLQLPPELNDKVKSLTNGLSSADISLPVSDFNLPSIDLKGLGNVSVPGLNLPNVSTIGINGIDTSVPNANLPNTSLPDINNPLGDKMNDIKDIQGQVPTSVDDVAGAAENKIGEMTEVKELENNLPTGGQLPNEEETKEQLANQAKKAAVDHFAGKEEQLKAAMDKMSKYKKNYSSVQSIKDLPARPPNPLKNKPFVERLVPSVTFQVLKRNEWMTDIAPYLGYRFTPRLSAGFGWNSRVVFEPTTQDNKVYGPRVYGEFKVFKGVSGRLELEMMNTFVAANLLPGSDVGRREWVPAILAGMKKDYKIYKRLKGTAFMLYNFYNPHYKSPYGDRLNIRFGFEYVIKKNKKKDAGKK